MSNLPRIPVRFLEHNAELLKSQDPSDLRKSTDYTFTEDVGAMNMGPQYNAPQGRVLGNQLFRRYPNGMLDLDGAKHTVVDIIHKVKDQGPLTELEKLVLGCIFPLVFPFVDGRLSESLTRVQLKLAPWEIDQIAHAVSAHLTAEMSYNAGIGGGGDPGRAVTRS